jgi:1D-myo-inositol-tetrakisphosphate 5-kinase/inositol-polyphosphate multikinase
MDKDSIPIPTSPTGTQLFSHQIAGHNDILLLSPTVLAKPVTETELSFYLDAQDPQHSAVRGYMPEFGGEVTFPNPDPNGPLQLRYFKLENLLAEFTSPCVLDVKLGTRLYDSDASEEKREKMRGQAESTTSGVVGVRVCGMKVGLLFLLVELEGD